MSYFEGLHFFLVAIPFLLLTLLLFKHRKISIWSQLVISLFFIVAVYTKNLKTLAFLISYLVIEWINVSTYLSLRKKYKRKKSWYYLSLAIALLPLVINKITSATGSNIYGFLGISYISFKTITIVIEIYDGLIKDLSLKTYVLFMTYFPTMSSGPIDRYRRFDKDINTDLPKEEYQELIGTGLYRLVLGAVYKFVISIWLYDILMKLSTSFDLPVIIGYIYVYAFYLFFDFAGYSLMAVGMANIMGISTPMNFNKPFIALNIKDFWNRWHITLSFWFRDYLFSRIVKNMLKKKIFKNMLITAAAAYIINMFVMGAWHGITKSYLLYGLFHGVLLALTEIYEQKSSFYKKYRQHKIYQFFSWLITFHLVIFSFFIFSGRFMEYMAYLF